MASYQTIKALSEGLYKEKGSKFLAFAVPVQSEEEVKAFIAQKIIQAQLDKLLK